MGQSRKRWSTPAPFPHNALVSVRVEGCDYAAKCINVSNGAYTFKTLRSESTFNALLQGRGTVDWTPNKPLYKYRTPITLTATPRTGWEFTGWRAAQIGWADAARRYRLPMRIAANGYARRDKAVETVVDFTTLFATVGETAVFDPDTLRVVEVNAAGQIVDGNVPFQFDPVEGYDATTNALGTVIFLLKGITPANEVRDYHLYFDQAGAGLAPPSFTDLVVRSEVTDEGQASFRVAMTNATWYYHKFGGGFSSLVDVDGNDWLGFHPTPNSGGGFFRGIPNLVPPNTLPPPYDGGILHPGKNDATTVGMAGAPLKETLRTTTSDGQWVLQWEFFPTYARMTILQKPAGRSYWFLAEGTPGGEGECGQQPCDLESDDFWTLPTGQSQSLYEPIGGELSAPEWIYFSDPDVDGPSVAARSLFVIHHDDDLVYDAYYPFVDKKMTVFGFGRRLSDNTPGMTDALNVFTVGLMDETAIDPATATINAAYKELWVAQGGVEAQSIPGDPTTSPLFFTISGNTVVSATFVPLIPLTLTTPVVGHGSVSKDPNFPAYAPGDVVTLTATADLSSIFTGWTGDFVSDEPTLIDGVTTYEPIFSAMGGGSGSNVYLPLISQQ